MAQQHNLNKAVGERHGWARGVGAVTIVVMWWVGVGGEGGGVTDVADRGPFSCEFTVIVCIMGSHIFVDS